MSKPNRVTYGFYKKDGESNNKSQWFTTIRQIYTNSNPHPLQQIAFTQSAHARYVALKTNSVRFVNSRTCTIVQLHVERSLITVLGHLYYLYTCLRFLAGEKNPNLNRCNVLLRFPCKAHVKIVSKNPNVHEIGAQYIFSGHHLRSPCSCIPCAAETSTRCATRNDSPTQR